MARRLNYLDIPSFPDLFILEFAVNNYQGEDYNTWLDHKTDVYFRGFEQMVECTEIVIGWILYKYPDTAILFLDLHSAVPNRKTAQSLHVGVAQHYQVPVISYADAMMPEYFRLSERLKPYSYHMPTNMVDQMNIDFPFPHGCSPCRLEDIIDQFRGHGCVSLCTFMEIGGALSWDMYCDPIPSDMQPCHVPMYAHDEVHLSKIGHSIARDLIANMIAQIAHDNCQGRVYPPHLMPVHGGWIVAASTSDKSYISQLLALSDFAVVYDLQYNFATTPELVPLNHTSGFQMLEDNAGRRGWVSTNSTGGESITFAIDLPIEKCYAVHITILKSYSTVGTLTVAIFDGTKKITTKSMDIDCLWGAHISIPVDMQLSADNSNECTGNCLITITTHPEIEGRKGNMINIKSLSARRCV
jgi:hypothetical protein